jgi:hypothetical protein
VEQYKSRICRLKQEKGRVIYALEILDIVITFSLPGRLQEGVTFGPIDLGPHATINLIFLAAAIFGDGSYMGKEKLLVSSAMRDLRLRRNVTTLG